MKLKELEWLLQTIQGFENPKVHLEQYVTPPHIAACMLHTIDSQFGDIADKLVLDLGCGSGMLTLGCAALGAGFVLGVDVDADALSVCRRNMEDTETSGVDLVNIDIDAIESGDARFIKHFDTVIMNPPFGTKQNKGLDIKFLRRGLDLTRGAVYSLHKTATREHVAKKCNEWNVNMQVVAKLRYDLPQTYKFHKKRSVDIEVDFIRFTFRNCS